MKRSRARSNSNDSIKYIIEDGVVKGINKNTGVVEIEAKLLPPSRTPSPEIVVEAEMLPTYEKGEILKTEDNTPFGKVKNVHSDGTYDIQLNRENVLLKRLSSDSIDDYSEIERKRNAKLNPLIEAELEEFMRSSKKKKKQGRKRRGSATKKVKKAKKAKKSRKSKNKKKAKGRKTYRKRKSKSKSK